MPSAKRRTAHVRRRAPASPDSRIRAYRRHRGRVGEKLILAVFRAHATVEAVQKVNAQLEQYGLFDVDLLPEEVLSNVRTIMRAEVAHILAQSAHLPARVKRSVLHRVTARMIPLRDGTELTGRLESERRMMARHETLAGALRRATASVTPAPPPNQQL